MTVCKHLNNTISKHQFHLHVFHKHVIKGTGDDDMTDSAVREVVSPETSIGTASDVSQSRPSSKDEGLSNDTSAYYCIHILILVQNFVIFLINFPIMKINTRKLFLVLSVSSVHTMCEESWPSQVPGLLNENEIPNITEHGHLFIYCQLVLKHGTTTHCHHVNENYLRPHSSAIKPNVELNTGKINNT